jgi:hypothetical protein
VETQPWYITAGEMALLLMGVILLIVTAIVFWGCADQDQAQDQSGLRDLDEGWGYGPDPHTAIILPGRTRDDW